VRLKRRHVRREHDLAIPKTAVLRKYSPTVRLSRFADAGQAGIAEPVHAQCMEYFPHGIELMAHVAHSLIHGIDALLADPRPLRAHLLAALRAGCSLHAMALTQGVSSPSTSLWPRKHTEKTRNMQ
jgi:hypothetical protein